jgi:hypothetical protein
MWRRIAAPFVLLIFCTLASSQIVSRAYAGPDGKAHIVFANGKSKTIASEDQQVGCENVLLSPDGHTVGWSILYKNCCTSYPIPTAVVTFRNDKKSYISSPQMIHNWNFVGRGEQIAVLFGPVHGNPSGVNLYDTRTGKLVDSWYGKSPAPGWAKDWANVVSP